MNMNDATVAIRSLPRRYGEVVSGPKGDDNWDRIVRVVGPQGRSALGFVVHATDLLTALGTAIAALPIQSRPPVAVAPLETKYSEPSPNLQVAKALDNLKSAAERAATAVHGRSPEELDRACMVDGKEVDSRAFVERIVTLCVSHLKDAKDAIDAAA